MTTKYSAGKIMILALLSLFISATAIADSQQCLKCHKKIVDQTTDQLVIHPPFLQNRCTLCHSPAKPDTGSDQPEETSIVQTATPNMEWLAESFTESTRQTALLPMDICDAPLTIKLWYHNREKQQQQLTCPDLAAIPTQRAATQKPTTSNLQLTHYNDQLFARATLRWKTNVPCRCQLLYRSDNQEYADNEDDFYTLTHNHEIRNFNPKNTQISIQCDDTFQQHIQNQYIPLASLPVTAEEPEESQSLSTADFTIEFKQMGEVIEAVVTTTQPAAVAIGRIEQPAEDQTEVQQIVTTEIPESNEATQHPPLVAEKQINTTVCFQCHKETVEVASHPINVTAPPGMTIPPEYPLLSDGRMTCMTCHTRHGSNNEARLLKGGKKELCTGCHTNY